jgi:hypothetical protein
MDPHNPEFYHDLNDLILPYALSDASPAGADFLNTLDALKAAAFPYGIPPRTANITDEDPFWEVRHDDAIQSDKESWYNTSTQEPNSSHSKAVTNTETHEVDSENAKRAEIKNKVSFQKEDRIQEQKEYKRLQKEDREAEAMARTPQYAESESLQPTIVYKFPFSDALSHLFSSNKGESDQADAQKAFNRTHFEENTRTLSALAGKPTWDDHDIHTATATLHGMKNTPLGDLTSEHAKEGKNALEAFLQATPQAEGSEANKARMETEIEKMKALTKKIIEGLERLLASLERALTGAQSDPEAPPATPTTPSVRRSGPSGP